MPNNKTGGFANFSLGRSSTGRCADLRRRSANAADSFRRLSWAMKGVAAAAASGIVYSVLSSRSIFERASFILTALGVIVALIIYSRQDRESEFRQSKLEEQGNNLLKTIEAFGNTADETESSEEPELYPSAVDLLTEKGIPLSDNYLSLSASDVPLAPLGAVISHWEDSGATGRWRVGDLQSSIRRAGRGNHPWHLVFRDPRTDQPRIWRVSRGGQGKSGPTVQEL